MKLKKIVAAAAAAVMALTMLTACSGGGGGNGSGSIIGGSAYTRKMTVVEENGVKPTTTKTKYQTSDGKSIYTENVNGNFRRAYLSCEDGSYYIINPSNNKAYKETDDEVEEGNAAVTSTEGKWTYGEKEYKTREFSYVETDEDGTYKSTTKYCYDGMTLAYIVYELESAGYKSTTVAHVDEMTYTADASKLNIKNYDQVGTYEELGFAY